MISITLPTTLCRAGHETSVDAAGRRYCRTCRAATTVAAALDKYPGLVDPAKSAAGGHAAAASRESKPAALPGYPLPPEGHPYSDAGFRTACRKAIIRAKNAPLHAAAVLCDRGIYSTHDLSNAPLGTWCATVARQGDGWIVYVITRIEGRYCPGPGFTVPEAWQDATA